MNLDEACKAAELEHAEHKTDCNKKQAQFELAFCTWRTEVTDACKNLDTCYSDKVKAYQTHLDVTKELVKKWKTEFKALKKIVCYTNVWLASTNTADMSDQYAKCKAE